MIPFGLVMGHLILWFCVDQFYADQAIGQEGPAATEAVRLVRYEHVNSEITRYRDLVWKIVPLTWAIYFAIYNYRGFLPGIYPQVLLVTSAVIGSIFYTYCEVMTEHNRRRRRRLEDILELDEQFRHREPPIHYVGLIFCFFVFVASMWIPVFSLLYRWPNG